MAKSDPQEEPPLLVPETSFSPAHPQPSKSILSNFLPKLLFLAFLLFLPLSPSRAPEFINQTIFAQFWEFLHILFFGIAVCYGLLSRKNQNAGVHANAPPQSQSLTIRSQNYLSGILHFPSASEEENNTIIRLDEKTRIDSWNSRYLPPRSMEMSVPVERTKPRSAMGYKPLGLPVRSLRSTKVDHTDIQQESSDHRTWSGSDSVSSVEVEKEKVTSDHRTWSGSDSVSSVEVEKEKVKGLVPVNLEKKFREASAIPWKRSSGSGRRKKRVAESESFWASVLSENSSLPYPSKSTKETREDGKLEGRTLSRGESVRTIRKSTEDVNRKSSSNVSSPTQNDEKDRKGRDPPPDLTCEEEGAERSSSSSIDSNAIDEVEEEESVERGGVDGAGDEDDDGKEVDRKADEFIAKFREQIRLQKIHSARGFKHW